MCGKRGGAQEEEGNHVVVVGGSVGHKGTPRIMLCHGGVVTIYIADCMAKAL